MDSHNNAFSVFCVEKKNNTDSLFKTEFFKDFETSRTKFTTQLSPAGDFITHVWKRNKHNIKLTVIICLENPEY